MASVCSGHLGSGIAPATAKRSGLCSPGPELPAAPVSDSSCSVVPHSVMCSVVKSPVPVQRCQSEPPPSEFSISVFSWVPHSSNWRLVVGVVLLPHSGSDSGEIAQPSSCRLVPTSSTYSTSLDGGCRRQWWGWQKPTEIESYGCNSQGRRAPLYWKRDLG